MAFRQPLRPAASTESLLPARYVRLQVASPPPRRVDGTLWKEGLVDSDGTPFDPGRPPADKDVVPLGGIAPLGQPDPETIVLDRWLAVPAVPPTRSLTRTFAMGTADTATRPLTFLSVPYPDPSVDGTRLDVAGVAYYCEGKIVFDRRSTANGSPSAWTGSSLQSEPARTTSYGCSRILSESAARWQPRRRSPSMRHGRVADPGTTSASRSSPGSA